jgi:hypothetical protein
MAGAYAQTSRTAADVSSYNRIICVDHSGLLTIVFSVGGGYRWPSGIREKTRPRNGETTIQTVRCLPESGSFIHNGTKGFRRHPDL